MTRNLEQMILTISEAALLRDTSLTLNGSSRLVVSRSPPHLRRSPRRAVAVASTAVCRDGNRRLRRRQQLRRW